jgi:hypothetical protein
MTIEAKQMNISSLLSFAGVAFLGAVNVSRATKQTLKCGKKLHKSKNKSLQNKNDVERQR